MYAYMHGEEIQAMREERGLSRREFAEAAGIAESTVARAEHGGRIRATTSWKLARVFGIHPMEIGTPDPTGEAAPTLRCLMGLER